MSTVSPQSLSATGQVTIIGASIQNQTLTAVTETITDPDGLGTFSYQWNSDGVAIPAGNGNSTFTLTEAQVGTLINVTVSYVDGLGTAESVASAFSDVVVNANDAPTGGVTISGTLTQNQTLTANSTLGDADGLGQVLYQWFADGEPFFATNLSEMVLDEAQVGKSIHVTANYVDGHGVVERVSSAATAAVVNVNDVPTGAMTVVGTAAQDDTLAALSTLVDPDGLGVIHYQWNVDGTALAGATASTLTLGEAQVGKDITLTAGYTDGQGNAELVTSTATGPVANANDWPAGTVVIAGVMRQGQVLTASNTLSDVDGLGSIVYQWSANGVAIANAVGPTLALALPQVGKTIAVAANYTDGHGTAESVVSSPTAAVAAALSAPIFATGTDSADLLMGGDDSDTLIALGGNDTLIGLGSGDTLNGGLGLDTAVYANAAATYAIKKTVTGLSVASADGTDALIDIERLQFSDTTMAFDTDGNAAQAYRLYFAAFNHVPDKGALGNSIVNMDHGLSLQQTADVLLRSTEFQTLYGVNASDTQFVTQLYTNALHRSAEPAGLAYWVNQIGNHLQTRAQVLANFSESVENRTAALPSLQNGISYTDPNHLTAPTLGGFVTGTAAADLLTGGVSNDKLVGLGGADSLDGRAGIDIAVYSGTRASHTVTTSATGLRVVDITGLDGTDSLNNVERLQFSDESLAFDVAAGAGQAYRLYQVFDRIPGKAELGSWIAAMDGGLTLPQVAHAFVVSPEFETLYGVNPTNAQLVDALYSHTLHRPAEAAGQAYWINQLTSGLQTKDQVLVGFSESTENQAALVGVMQLGVEYFPG